jgi:hypothetical protein
MSDARYAPVAPWFAIQKGDEFLSQRRLLRVICLILIAVFYVMSVPWYRDTESPLKIWWGLPDWVTVALLCYVGVAVMNAAAWMLADVSDDLDGDEFGHSASPSASERQKETR